MKTIFFTFLAICLGMYLVGLATLERDPDDGIVRMKWATDPNPARTQQLSRFGDMFPGYLVEVDPGLGGDQSKLIVQAAAGIGPDLIDIYDYQQMIGLVEAGILLDITEYAERYGFTPDRTFPAVQDDLMVDGRQYRFPANIATVNVLFNKEIFDRYGVRHPEPGWTFDDLIEIGIELREAAQSRNERIFPLAGYGIMQLLTNFGADFFHEGGLVSALDSPEAVAAMQMRFDLMHVHNIIPTPAEASAQSSQGGWGQGELQWFANGRAAMYIIGRWFIVQLPNYPGLADNLGIVPLPRVEGRPSVSTIGTRAVGINRQGRNVESAILFLRYLASEEYSELIVADGDGLPPNPATVPNGQAMVNSMLGDAAIHQGFLDAVKCARGFNASPYIDLSIVNRWIFEREGQVLNRLRTPEEAMQGLAREINDRIRLNLERRPDLQRRFEDQLGQPWEPNWFRSYQPVPFQARFPENCPPIPTPSWRR